MKYKKLLSFLPLLLSSWLVYSQEEGLAIQNLSTCNNSAVSVALTLENIDNIGAVSLFIAYDSTHLDFVRLENIHPFLNGLLYNRMTYPQNQIGISWINTMGVSFDSAVLFEMVFEFQDQQNTLVFTPACEITSTDMAIIPVVYSDGAISPLVSIANQPEDRQIVTSQSTSFQIVSSGGDSYRWQKSEGGALHFADLVDDSTYQGSQTETLNVNNTSLFMDGFLFRCKIITGACTTFSTSATLSVIGMEHEIELNAGWNSLSTFVNPPKDEIETVMADIMSSLIILLNDQGFYYPGMNTDTIGHFDPMKAYYLKLTNAKTLHISGLRNHNNQLSIPPGWSYLPVISECNHTILDLFGANIQDVIIIKEIAGSNVYWPEKSITTLQLLQTGKSYVIKTVNPLNVDFPECGE